jgi:uncharacterized damage-inducible protein DinB
MTTKAWALEMALYNKWQNDGLFGLCDALPDAERKRDRGMFFGSIHHTLDHMLMVDGRLMEYVVAGQPPKTPFEARRIVHPDYADLKRERATFDDGLLPLIEGKPDGWLDEAITLERSHVGRPRTSPRQFYMMQIFNHGTHHRSQITSELHKMGIAYGNTDLPFNPHSQY